MTPAGLIELMHHQAKVLRHSHFVSGEQVTTLVATLPCYVDASKSDQAPPMMNAYLGVVDTAPVRQGDYLQLIGELAEWPTGWSLGAVQTWWGPDGAYWCQQAGLDAPAERCSVQTPNNNPDSEGRFVGWTTEFTFLGGVRSLTAFEQRRAAQTGEQVDVMFRYPTFGINLTRANRVVVETGPYVNTYEVITIQPHADSSTAALRRYEPAGTPI